MNDDMPSESVTLLKNAIEASGLSIRRYAVEVLGRDERNVRRWLAGDAMPNALLKMLKHQAEQPKLLGDDE